MRAVIQRVTQSSVNVADKTVARIGNGLLVLLGLATSDGPKEVNYMAAKIVHLRIFEDDQHKMNRSLLDVGGEMLVVSQFTLLGDCRKGRRPSFIEAAPPARAQALYTQFVEKVTQWDISVKTGQFQAMMAVSLINDGPVTLILESPLR